ncbi:MAG: hypothetical protein NC938_06090 [Candidatus Omnitrophica bacterium]|nr:hypothetical protein [Candidatus Omnitrophota bacterium]MCM8791247.1 hypothetical protein [Candidatus Omnitrophota bacterium]
MDTVQTLIHYLPSFFIGILVMACALTLVILGLVFVRKKVPHQKLKTHNDIAGAIFSTLGVTYAVLLAFVVVVWQSFDQAKKDVEKRGQLLG